MRAYNFKEQDDILAKLLELNLELAEKDQTVLIEIIQNRLRQQKRDRLEKEIEEVRQEYREGQITFGSVGDFLAELDRE
ncbi:hypothetical protein [Myxosarcina sp. GI1(2024)]